MDCIIGELNSFSSKCIIIIQVSHLLQGQGHPLGWILQYQSTRLCNMYQFLLFMELLIKIGFDLVYLLYLRKTWECKYCDLSKVIAMQAIPSMWSCVFFGFFFIWYIKLSFSSLYCWWIFCTWHPPFQSCLVKWGTRLWNYRFYNSTWDILAAGRQQIHLVLEWLMVLV